jgi:hypothetical protein
MASTDADSAEKDEVRSRETGRAECWERRCSILVRSIVLEAGRFEPSLAAMTVTSSGDITRCEASLCRIEFNNASHRVSAHSMRVCGVIRSVPALRGRSGLESGVGDGLVLLELADLGRDEGELLEVDQTLHLVRQLLKVFRDQTHERS